ncbi:MAG: hypothetical protein NVS4B1_33410 [Ktedonobacteraceae bacterium]
MAERLVKSSDVGEYTLYPFSAVTGNTHVTGTGTHGDFVLRVTVNNPGSGMVVTLANGTTATAANVFAVIASSTGGDYSYEGVCDNGLYIAITATTMGHVTVAAMPMAV